MDLNKGFEIIEGVYSKFQVNRILDVLNGLDLEEKFGVREFLYNHTQLQELIFTPKLKQVIEDISPDCNLSIKSIYFDKPPNANWIVNWHQDLTINLRSKYDIKGFKNWRDNDSRVVVQPTIDILENIFTIRIHLDDCTKQNGALRLIEQSHKSGVVNVANWTKNKQGKEVICEVRKGGLVVMKPLVLHSSKRTENELSRRVIHIEFCNHELASKLEWKEPVYF